MLVDELDGDRPDRLGEHAVTAPRLEDEVERARPVLERLDRGGRTVERRERPRRLRRALGTRHARRARRLGGARRGRAGAAGARGEPERARHPERGSADHDRSMPSA
ncbi:MAG: hypothetical protein KF729_16780 [Sandaracinaceae bacterium]|nr:hypothetical protein [Sandaracinaceae bacterium]